MKNTIERIIEKIVNHKYYKKGKDFSKYSFIGVLWTTLNIFFMWLMIDMLKFPTVYSAFAVVTTLFVGKFYAYRLIGFMENNFLKYASTVIGFQVANIFFMWLFVDIFKWKAVVSSAIIVTTLFVLRFVVFNKVGLIKNE